MTPDMRQKIRAALISAQSVLGMPALGSFPSSVEVRIAEALALLDQEEAALPTPDVEAERDALGRIVREAWVRWALTQPNPKPSWLTPYDALAEPDKEADRQIGEAVATFLRVSALPEEGQPEGMETMEGPYSVVCVLLRHVDRLLAERNALIGTWKGKRIRELEAELTAALAARDDATKAVRLTFATIQERARERDAAIASSEADRAALTRCLETQRKIEAENARLRAALEPFAGDDDGFVDQRTLRDAINRARAALAAEGGET